MKITANKRASSGIKSTNTQSCKQDASEYIRKAIEALSSDEDAVSKESIANLSVVLLDLKSSESK